ncbi:MAG TPA: hypothetical protein VFA90_04110 [Terriglobales bacterium]|nr:hypothetical protein [Terriglobales bacterium]
MKQILSNLHWPELKFGRTGKLFAVSFLAILSLPGTARAIGLTDILTLLNTITGTIKNVIGGALGEIQMVKADLNTFEETVLWPVAALNQTRGFINSTRNQYQSLMNQIHAISNNSATLATPIQLENLFRSSNSANLGQLSPVYTTVYASVPGANNASQIQRDLMDMDDALAVGSLKTAVVSDQTTSEMLSLADSIEQQSSTAAPGSGPMLATEGQIASLESQAYLTKILAADLRQEAAKLANQNMLMKQSAANTRNLQNQIQQVLAHP